MNTKLKQWLDANTDIEIDRGDAYWYRRSDGIRMIGYITTEPWMALTNRADGESIYTDNMSYCDHGWGYGADSKVTAECLYALLPQDLADEVRAEYAEYNYDQLAQDIQDYLQERNGWDFDYDYFESSMSGRKGKCGWREGKMTDDDIIRALDLQHDPDFDECDEDIEDDLTAEEA